MTKTAFDDALADFVEAALRIGPEAARDRVSALQDQIADEMDQDTSNRETALLDQISAALLTVQGWEDEGAGRVVLVLDLDRGQSAHFQWGDDAPVSPAYAAAIRNAVSSLCGLPMTPAETEAYR